MKRSLVLLTLMSLLLAACGAPTPNTEATGHVAIVATQTAQPTDTPTFTSIPALTPTSTWTPTPTDGREPTDTPTPTSTPTPIPTYALSGVVFFDYNGNGVQDGDEPPIPDARVQVGTLSAASASDGTYVLQGVSHGSRTVTISAEGFRYISLSSAAFQPSDRPISLTINGDTERNWGLMQGFLTLPFPAGTHFSIGRHYDHNPTDGQVLWWNGNEYSYTNQPGRGADDNHTGTDLDADIDTLVLAAAPGYVIFVGSIGGSNVVEVRHLNGFHTVYHHLSRTLVEAKPSKLVPRGTAIGEVGMTGTFYPHLHFEGGPRGNAVDPYMPSFQSDGYWHWEPSRQKMIWRSAAPASNPNGLGYWTMTNNPQFP